MILIQTLLKLFKDHQPVSKLTNQYKSSLLINDRLIDLIHQPLCKCGAIWSCKLAEGTIAQKNTNAVFHLSCPSCDSISIGVLKEIIAF
jgi:hypothetical protein